MTASSRPVLHKYPQLDFEPAHPAPEAGALSSELWGLTVETVYHNSPLVANQRILRAVEKRL